jgi:CBS domain-containing protein
LTGFQAGLFLAHQRIEQPVLAPPPVEDHNMGKEEYVMFVDTILQSKGDYVYTLTESAPLVEAISLLTEHGIGAVVITSVTGHVVGILSERDIVHQLSRNPTDVLHRSISEAMTRDVATVTRQTSIADVMEQMTARRARHMPVLENDRLVGIVSIGDVVKSKIAQAEHEADELREYIAS